MLANGDGTRLSMAWNCVTQVIGAAACVLAAATASAQQKPFAADSRSSQVGVQEAVIKAARAEGALNLYASVSETQIKILLAAFEHDSGIKSTYLRLVSVPLIQRFVTENDAKKNDADVFFDSSPEATELYPQWFLSLTPAVVPNLSKWPAQWVGGKYVTLQTSPFVIQYNTQQVSSAEVPKTWSEVLNPKWKGKIALTDPRISNIYLGWVDAMEKRFGAGFLTRFAAQDFKLTQSGAAGAQMVAAGAYALNFPAYATFAVPLIEKKAPIATQIISDPVLVNETSVAIASQAKHPNVARAFVNWLLSEGSLRTACKAFPISTPGDPEGKLGCVAVKDPRAVNRTIAEDRKKALLQQIGLGTR